MPSSHYSISRQFSGAHFFRIKNLLTLLSAGMIALTGIGLTTVPAKADLRMCNTTESNINVAIGYRNDTGWHSEGWWVAKANECIVLLPGALQSRFFYIHAADDSSGGAWVGKSFMCTKDAKFTILGVQDCLARGYEKTGFFEVDTQNKSEWTLQLTEADLTSLGGL